MVFTLCVAKSKSGDVVLSSLRSSSRFGLPKYIKSLCNDIQLPKWVVGEYKNYEIIIYAKDIVSEVNNLSKVNLVLPVRVEGGYSDAYVIGPAFICLAHHSEKGLGKGGLIERDRGLSGYFSDHTKKLCIRGESAALLTPDFGGDYRPMELEKTS